MALVKLYNKERNVTYVYDSFSYWDKEKKQPRSKRKLLGKLDPETGEIVPTGGPRKKKTASLEEKSEKPNSDTVSKQQYDRITAAVQEKESMIQELRRELEAEKQKSRSYRNSLLRAKELLGKALSE